MKFRRSGLQFAALAMAASACGSEGGDGPGLPHEVGDAGAPQSPTGSSSECSTATSASSQSSSLLAARPGIAWQQRGKRATADRIAGCKDGSLYALDFDKTLHRNTAGGADNGWIKVGAAQDAKEISCTDRLWAFNLDRSLWRNDGTPAAPRFTRVGAPTGAKMVSAGFWIGLYNNAVSGLFALNDDNTLWQSTTGADGSWTRIGQPKGAARVEAGVSGLWALNTDKTLWRGSGVDGSWVKVDTPFDARFVTDNGSVKNGALWAINTNQTLWHGVVNGGMEGEVCRPPCYGQSIALAYSCDRCDADLACGNKGLCAPAGGYMELCQEPASITSSPGCDPGQGLTCSGGLCRRVGQIGEPCNADGKCNGDIVCAANNTCVSPIVAATNCSSTSRDCNVCAKDVPGQFRAMFAQGKRSKTTHSWKFNYNDSFPPSNMKPLQPFDDDNAVKQGTHFQSFVRTNDPNFPYAGTHSDDKDGVMFIIKQNPSEKRLTAFHRTRTVHPAGMQALGQFLVYGDGPDLRVHDMTGPTTLQTRTLALPTPGLGDAGDGLGAVKLASGDTLLVVGPENNNKPTAWRFYFASGSIATTSQVKYISEATSANWLEFIDPGKIPRPFDVVADPTGETHPLSSENLGVIPECGTGKIYVVNSIGDDDYVPTDGLWRLSRLEFVGAKMMVMPVDYAFVSQNLNGCHLRSTGTVWTDPAGAMHFYCHDRAVTKFLESSESVSFTGFAMSTPTPPSPPPPPPGGTCCGLRADGTCESYAPAGKECP